MSRSVQSRTRADLEQDWQIMVRGWAKACVTEPGCLENRFMDKSRATRARPDHCMAKQDVALVSLKLTKLVLKKYGNTVA